MAITAQQEGFRSLLKKRDFLRLWLAQLISMTILNASNYALLILIEEVTGSTTLVGLAIICFSLPALILGAPAGTLVDRLNKRRVLWISNMLRAAATFLFVLSLIWNQQQLVPVYLLTFLISSIGQFFTPAEGSTIPVLVSEEELMPALSLFNITFMLSQALGFILFAPILLSVLPTFSIAHVAINPVETLYAIIGIFYVVCAILIMLIPQQSFTLPAHQKVQRITTQQLEVMGSIWKETLQGWKFIRGNKQLFLAVIQLSFAGILLLVIGELATPIVTKLLLLSPNAMAFVFAPAGIGLVAGSVVMPRITMRMGKSRAIIVGTIAVTIVALFLPFSTIIARFLQPHGWNTNPLLLIAVALLMFAAGVALDFINIPAQTAIQQQTPDWIKGRVLALQLMLYNAFAIPVILFIGAIADIFGLDRVLYLMAVCIIVFGLWGKYYEHKHPNIILPGTSNMSETELEADTVSR